MDIPDNKKERFNNLLGKAIDTATESFDNYLKRTKISEENVRDNGANKESATKEIYEAYKKYFLLKEQFNNTIREVIKGIENDEQLFEVLKKLTPKSVCMLDRDLYDNVRLLTLVYQIAL